MPEIDYGDFYKFLASVGIALIILAILTPWLFLREPFDLSIEAEHIKTLSPRAQDLVLKRQDMVSRIFPAIPAISCVLLVVGIVVTSIGLFHWHGRQKLRDRGEDYSVEIQRRELEGMSPDRIENRAAEDASQDSGVPFETTTLQETAATVLRAGSQFHQFVTVCLSSSYRVLKNQSLGTAEYDVILQPKNKDVSDNHKKTQLGDISNEVRHKRNTALDISWAESNNASIRAYEKRSQPVC